MWTVLWACLAGWMSLRVHVGLLFVGFVSLFGLALGLGWCGQVWRRFVVHRRVPVELDWRGWLAWAFRPATGLVLTVLFLTQIPLAARVKVSETALLRLVEREYKSVDWPVRAGAMFVKDMDVQDKCSFLLTNEAPIFRMYGLVHVRHGGSPEGRYRGFRTSCHHLVGNWWTFVAVD